MNLIYICVFHQENYIKLLLLLINSIVVKTEIKETTNILIITCPAFQILIQKELETFNLSIQYYLLDLHTLMEASSSKLKIFDYPEIDKYRKILYLDTDVLINSDLNVLLNIEISPEKLYALEEGNICHVYWGAQFFNFRIHKNKKAFSAGVCYFMNSTSMKTLFQDTNTHITNYMSKNNLLPECLEQPFLIYNSFMQNKYDNVLMKKYVKNNPDLVDPEIIIYHFPGGTGHYSSKYNKMVSFWNKIIK